MQRVLVADYVDPLLITGLRDLGYSVQYAPEIERPEVLAWIGSCEGIVVNTKTKVDEILLNAASALRWVARLGSGLDTIDLHTAQNNQVTVISTPEANANAVAEHCFAMLLSLVRRINIADREVRAGLWNREGNRGRELSGRTIGIIGFGNTGSAFATKFAGWGVTVLAHDKYKSGFANAQPFVRECTLEQVLSDADVISLHLPLTEETFHYVNAGFLDKCKPGVILLNSSRGSIVDTPSLVLALQQGRISGAGLDVLENEKPDSYSTDERQLYDTLADMDNVVLTPHIAGWTFASKRRIAESVVHQVTNWQKRHQ